MTQKLFPLPIPTQCLLHPIISYIFKGQFQILITMKSLFKLLSYMRMTRFWKLSEQYDRPIVIIQAGIYEFTMGRSQDRTDILNYNIIINVNVIGLQSAIIVQTLSQPT